MGFDPIRVITSNTLVLEQENIDTDQIIPARFLTTTEREGLGAHAFQDWRYDESGAAIPDHPLNAADASEKKVLVGGVNFGCGSSREHAPWALHDFGFRAVISTDIADIFKSNALKNGLLPVEIDAETHRYLLDTPGVEVSIDLERQVLSLSNGREIDFVIEPFARQCLLDGVDALGALLNATTKIAAFEQAKGL